MIFLCPKCGHVLKPMIKDENSNMFVYACTNDKCQADWEVSIGADQSIKINPYYFG